jgi:selenocysteine lyase/cysteine desulfurase
LVSGGGDIEPLIADFDRSYSIGWASCYLAACLHVTEYINFNIYIFKNRKHMQQETIHSGAGIKEFNLNHAGTGKIPDVAFGELERGVFAALETYSNVHRGSGHCSRVSTELYERSRQIILNYLHLPASLYTVIFTTPLGAEQLVNQFTPDSFYCLSSTDFGLNIGVRAIAVKKHELKKNIRYQTGGGTARLISPDWVVWARAPHKYEAGTPAIMNVITFALAVMLSEKYGKKIFGPPVNSEGHRSDVLYDDLYEGLTGRDALTALRRDYIGTSLQVPVVSGFKRFINLDNAASTPSFMPVWNTYINSVCQPEVERYEVIDEVRSIAAEYFGAPADEYEIVFTSNTTQAINIAAENLKLGMPQDQPFVVVNTLSEHNSNELPWRALPGCELIRIAVSQTGAPDQGEFEKLLDDYNTKKLYGKKRVQLAAVTAVSNVLGNFNDLCTLSKITAQRNVPLLVDAAQLAAHRKIDMKNAGIGLLAFSAHKTYAPFGAGMLIIKKNLINYNPAELAKLKSSGEENSAGIAAMGKALLLLKQIGLHVIHEEEYALTKTLIAGMKKLPGVVIFGGQDELSPEFENKGGVVAFEIKKMFPFRLAGDLAEDGGIGIRSGCHCAHILIKHLMKVPPSLQNFQKLIVTVLPKVELPGVARVSLGIENTPADIEVFLQILEKLALKKQGRGSNSGSAESKRDMKLRMNEFIRERSLKVFG